MWAVVLLLSEARVIINDMGAILQGVMLQIIVIGGGNRKTWRKSPTYRKSLTNFITLFCIEYVPS
jgi:hypothetical protein